MKILIAGASGTGKAAFVGAVSEIDPLRTEEIVPGTTAAATVAVDLGRITLGDDLVLYLFGAPRQRGAKRDADAPFWEDLTSGALGAVVLAEAGRLAECVPSIDYFRHRGTPFLVAVDDVGGEPGVTVEQVRRELRLDAHIPVVGCDVRDRRSGREVLVTLVQHAGRLPRQRVG